MWGWYQEATIPPNLHIFGRLSQEVCDSCAISSKAGSQLKADLPSPRVLIVNIRNLGGCPCPRCLIPKDRLQNVTTANDMLEHNVLSRHDTVD